MKEEQLDKIIKFVRSNKGGFIISMSFMAIFFTFAYFQAKSKIPYLYQYGKLTPGVTTETTRTGRHEYINFKYIVKGLIYESNTGFVRGVKVPDGKYIVVYDPKNPIRSIILYHRKVKEKLGTELNQLVSRNEIKNAVWQQF